jgi:hypothetical protein
MLFERVEPTFAGIENIKQEVSATSQMTSIN